VGLTEAADRRVGGFSLGMRQRLGLASALLGEPEVLVLDEPANGLDPSGVHWLRQFLRAFASNGGTVVVSSHLLGEVAQLADDVVIIARGRMVTTGPLSGLIDHAVGAVRVRTPQPDALRTALDARHIAHRSDGSHVLATGTTTEAVGEAAAARGVILHELTNERSNLEDVFLQLTSSSGDRQ
jgi:ABC-2 type transport system ATP-binding protein